MSQFFFGFEGDNLRFRGASGHKLGTIFVWIGSIRLYTAEGG
jgi:hypothetical protein